MSNRSRHIKIGQNSLKIDNQVCRADRTSQSAMMPRHELLKAPELTMKRALDNDFA
jgi:hypothetical protein